MPRTPYVPKRPALDPCPVEEVLALIGGKWKSRLLLLLSTGPHRLSALRRGLPPQVSNEVLLTQLQGLAADGLVDVAIQERGATTFRHYSLTRLGASLLEALTPVAAWGAERLRERGDEWSAPVASSAHTQ
jgi:DNA-binding HxlR family transcriptional regulator